MTSHNGIIITLLLHHGGLYLQLRSGQCGPLVKLLLRVEVGALGVAGLVEEQVALRIRQHFTLLLRLTDT
jgi:hypothetical protein